MLLLSKTFEIITEESAENGDAEERGFVFENEPHSFRETVELLRGGETSDSPCDGNARVWVTHYGEMDYRTGDTENESIHFSRLNSPHKARYWKLALKAAGLLR